MNIEINKKIFTQENLTDMILSCYDKTNFASKLGFTYFNGKISKKIDEIISKNNLDSSHFDSKKKHKARRKYPIIKKNCPVCNLKFDTQIGNKEERTTCSYKCSNIYFNSIRHTTESKKKTSDALNAFHVGNGTSARRDIICNYCQNIFSTKRYFRKFCSVVCAAKSNWNNIEYRKNLTNQANDRVKSGVHKGWAGRSKLKPSFPEQVTMEVLNELGVSNYLREKKVGSWFIDFAFEESKIAIEIDGKQHEEPVRKAKDKIKDEYLIKNGWKVFRIKWGKLTKEFRFNLKIRLMSILL